MRVRLVLVAGLLPLACGGSTTEKGVLADAGAIGADAATACLGATVTFKVEPAQSSAVTWCLGQPAGCSSEWLGITDVAGTGLGLSNLCGTPCDSCQMAACPNICMVPSALGAAGATRSWDGTYFAPGTCGPSLRSCQSPACAPAGRYKATVCGFANPTPDAGFGCGSATSSVPPTCVDASFDYPPTGPVVVTMPAKAQ